MIFWTVRYTNTQIQIHKTTNTKNTAYDKITGLLVENYLGAEKNRWQVRPLGIGWILIIIMKIVIIIIIVIIMAR